MKNDKPNSQNLADQMVQQRGREVPEWTWLAEFDPEMMAAYNHLASHAFGYYGDRANKPGALSPKVKELIAIALLTGQRDWDRVPTHLSRALDLGASDREIVDALQVAMVITGGPAMRMGIELLLKLHAEGH
jgi:alkylhydroperoxidase/carboxymuconolactone decarboxylase family protein YurZ